MKEKRFKWTLEVEIAESWVMDGFNFDQDRCQQVAENLIELAYPDEVIVRIVSAPSPKKIRKVQGYKN